MKLPTVLVISICSSNLTYSSGSQLALGNAASSLHTKRKKKNVVASNAIATLATLIFTPIVMNLNSLDDCNTEKECIHSVNIGFLKEARTKEHSSQ